MCTSTQATRLFYIRLRPAPWAYAVINMNIFNINLNSGDLEGKRWFLYVLAKKLSKSSKNVQNSSKRCPKVIQMESKVIQKESKGKPKGFQSNQKGFQFGLLLNGYKSAEMPNQYFIWFQLKWEHLKYNIYGFEDRWYTGVLNLDHECWIHRRPILASGPQHHAFILELIWSHTVYPLTSIERMNSKANALNFELANQPVT